ncbi:MAG: hypothetical protein WA061_05830 [Microgenomates group bacterium]
MPNIQEQSPEYIQPRVREFGSFDDAVKNYKRYGDLFPDLNDGTNPLEKEDFYKRAFIIADPGYGKTRLLNEIANKVKSQNKIAVYIDLKKLANSKFGDVEDYIRYLYPNLAEKDFSTINKTDGILCFDALDEVRDAQFSACLDLLKAFLEKYHSLSVLISSRIYFFKHHFFEVNDPSFSYWLIYGFSNDQIRRYLLSKGIVETDINRTFDLLKNSDRDLVISVPRYLELLPQYLKNKEISDLRSLNRTDLFEYFIYNKLELEEEKAGIKGKEIVKRVLEMLALTMEIYQANVLNKDDLTTFLDEISSGLNQFWHKIPVEFFYEKSLLKDDKDTIEFENTEFQEYLAAKHISRLNKPIQVAFDLMIDKEQLEVKPSWFSTLNFLVEIDQNFLKPLLDFGGRNQTKLVIDERYFQLLTRFNVEQIDPPTKKVIFLIVFDYYQKVLHWLDWTIGKNLSYYYVDDLHSHLLGFTEKANDDFQNDDQRSVQLANVAQIIGFLIRNNKLNIGQLNYWKEKLITYANEENGPGVLQRHALFALEAFKEPELIIKINKPWTHSESLVRRRFIEFCTETAPNHPDAIKYFIEAIICQEYEGYQGINRVTDHASLALLLRAFLDNAEFLFAFMDRDEGIFSTKSTSLIRNLASCWDNELKELSHKVVLKAFDNHETWYRAGDSPLIIGLCKQMQAADNSYIFQLIAAISSSDELKKHATNFARIFVAILPFNEFETFYEKLNQIENGKWVVLRTLREIKYSSRVDANQLYEVGRKYFADEYAQAESANQETFPGEVHSKSIYDDFTFKLQPEEGMYMPDVFSLFNHNYKDIERLITQANSERLIFLLNDSIFSKFDPGEHGIQDSNNHQTHTMHAWISIFGDALVTAHKLHMDTSQYRDKIVNYLPFSFEQAELEAIFALAGELNENDTERLLTRYQDRSNDLWRYHPRSFIEAAKKYKLIKAVPLLKEFVSESELSIYDRVDAMKAVSTLSENSQYLQEIFDTNLGAEDKSLSEEANALLIVEYKDVPATKWRLEQLKTRSFTFIRAEGAHSAGSNEIELDMKPFAKPLYSVFDSSLESDFLALLKKSFGLLKEDKEYLSYASYLWELVFAYFENRKREGSYKPINNLEKYLLNFQGKEGVNWFLGKLKELKAIYLQYVGKPPNYSSCVHTYNQIKESNYIKLNTHEDLLQEVADVIEKDISKFLLGEGSRCLKKRETEVQKQLKTEFENAFLRRNFRPSDIRNDFLVWRETQDITDKRSDFVISYGFLGPILIELKLTSHSEMAARISTLKSKKSYKSLQQYISSFRPTHSIFLVLDNKPRTTRAPWSKHLKNIREAYESIDSVKVIGLPLIS